MTEQLAFVPVLWGPAELEAGRERFEAAAGGFLSDSPAQLRCTLIDESRNLVMAGVAPELSEAGLRVLGQAITAAGVPVLCRAGPGATLSARGPVSA